MTMEKIKDTFIRILPEAVTNHIRNEKDFLQRLPQDLKAITDPVRRDTIGELKNFIIITKANAALLSAMVPVFKILI